MTKEQLTETTGLALRTIEGALRDIDANHERRGGKTGHGHNFYALPDTTDSQSPRSQLAIEAEA